MFGEDAVAVTPDEGQVTGREGITEYFRQFLDSLTDTPFESPEYESGDVAIDDGHSSGPAPGRCTRPIVGVWNVARPKGFEPLTF